MGLNTSAPSSSATSCCGRGRAAAPHAAHPAERLTQATATPARACGLIIRPSKTTPVRPHPACYQHERQLWLLPTGLGVPAHGLGLSAQGIDAMVLLHIFTSRSGSLTRTTTLRNDRTTTFTCRTHASLEIFCTGHGLSHSVGRTVGTGCQRPDPGARECAVGIGRTAACRNRITPDHGCRGRVAAREYRQRGRVPQPGLEYLPTVATCRCRCIDVPTAPWCCA